MAEIKNALSGVSENYVQALNMAVEAAGCVYEKDGKALPSKTGQFVYQVRPGEKEMVETQMGALGSCFNSLCYSLLSESPEIRKWLGVSAQEVDLAQETKPSEQSMVTYFGIDKCGPDWKVNDFNVDRATIVGFQPEFAEVFGEFFPWLVPHMTSFYNQLITEFQNLSGKDHSRIFVLHNENEAYLKPFTRFASRFGLEIGSMRDFCPRKYDLIFRAMKSEVILNEKDKYQDLINCLQAGLPMVNPLGSYLAGNKGWEAVLSLKSCSGVDPEWFPVPVILTDGLVAITVSDQKAEIGEWDEVTIDGLKKAKNSLVLKKAFSFGGNKVYIGKKAKAWEWSGLIDSIKLSGASWVIETAQPKIEADVQVGDSNAEGNVISVSKKLNLIQRWYGCGDFSQGKFELTGEVFGGESSKVNASGYTFPIAFSD